MKITAKIAKVDEHLVFGFASVSANADGQPIVDDAGDVIPIEELEQAAYKFVLESRQGGEMHETIGGAVLIESMIFTPQKLELLNVDSIPYGWWVGFKIVDEELWQKIKSGKYPMFSIGGSAQREADTDDNT